MTFSKFMQSFKLILHYNNDSPNIEDLQNGVGYEDGLKKNSFSILEKIIRNRGRSEMAKPAWT